MPRRPLWFALVALCGAAACSSRPPPPPLHSGWALRYTERVGGDNSSTVEHPELALAVFDQRARGAVVARNVSAQWSAPEAEATRCAEGRCAVTDRAAALAFLADTEGLGPIAGAVEAEPTFTRLDPGELVANVRTEGGRFVTALRFAGGRLAVEVVARWITAPTAPSVEPLRAFFTAALARLGARRLVDLVTREVGLPLVWEVTLRRYEGASDEPNIGTVRYRAVEINNPPSNL